MLKIGQLFALSGSGILIRLLAYYGTLVAVSIGVWSLLSDASQSSLNELLGPVLGQAAPGGSFTSPLTPAIPQTTIGSTHGIAVLATVVCVVATLLALPMAWVYMYTRQKKGYQQSVVHTIVLLPAIVAAISVLVRNNIALAFSLAGIVAAVRFRTSLEDSKDAVFIFAVSALGLACGVHIEFAAVLSMLFSLLALGLWYTDFGRTPPALEDARAERSMQRALEIANRTSQFVARIDTEILDGMAPAQLQALADRVRNRREAVGSPNQYDAELTVRVSDDEAARPLLEAALKERTKRWALLRSSNEDGDAVFVYGVKLKKGLKAMDLVPLIERDVAPYVASIDLAEVD